MTSLSVKRKLSNVDSDIVEGRLYKKLRVQQINSTSEIILNAETSSLAGCDCKTKGDEEIGALKKELQLLKTRLACVEQESNRKSGALSHIGSLTQCSICREVMHNPYTLECGHSACYRCLRRWWLTSCGNTLSGSDVNEIDNPTDGESDGEEERISLPPITISPTPFRESFASSTLYAHPQYLGSLLPLSSVLHSSKQCPECRKIVTNQPVPNYKLRDIIDALRPSPLSPMTQMQKDRRWGRRDAWRGIFPSGGDGTVIRSTQTQQAYIIPIGTQGHIQTPFSDSNPFHGHARHGVNQHRTNRSQPYNLSHPQRRNRRRWEPYDPVREARREMEEQRERQRRSRVPSPPVPRAVRVRLNRELPPLESTLLSRPLEDGFSHLDFPRRSLERSRELGLETPPVALSSAHQPQPPRPYLQQPMLFSRSPSRLNLRLQLPPIRELISLPLPSDATLPPLLNDLPTPFQNSRTAPHQHFPYSSLFSDNSLNSDDDYEGGEEENVQEKQGEESNENDDEATSSSSQTDIDAWIGADLED